MYSELPRPTIFAHRGACAHAPENTLAAFELAIQQGADAIELDAKLTADGQVVVFHDQTLDRTTGNQGWVGDKTLEQLRMLDCGSHFDIAFQGEHIPTLNEVFELFGRRIFINVELTNYASIYDSLPEKVAKLVQAHNLVKSVLFSSFNPIALWRARKALPEVPIGLLAQPGRGGFWARSWIGTLLSYQALHPEYRDVTEGLVVKTHRRGCRVHTYTVNRAKDMRHLFNLGVDGIFTDDPILARRILENTRERNP